MRRASPRGEPRDRALRPRHLARASARSRCCTTSSFDVRPGEVVALLGENGAGKSTLSNIIAGSLTPTPARSPGRGSPMPPPSPADAIDAGHRHDPPGAEAAARSLGRRERLRRPPADARRPDRPRGDERARLGAAASGSASTVSPDRKVRTLARRRAAAGRDRQGADAQCRAADPRRADRGARRRGDRAPVPADPQAEVRRHVLHLYQPPAGRDRADRRPHRGDARRPHRRAPRHAPTCRCARSSSRWSAAASTACSRRSPSPADEVLLEVEDLSSPDGTFRDVSFSVRAGEILGIAGLIGAGRTELVRAITGADPIASGTVRVDGKPLHARAARATPSRAGIVLVPEDRKAQGSCSTRRSARTSRSAISTASRRDGWVWPRRRAALRRGRHHASSASRAARRSRSASCPAATSRRW